MNANPFTLVIGLFAGLALGAFFFGGLWLTVRRLPTARQPAQVVLASFFVRTLVVLVGFFLLAQAGLAGPVAGLAGFLAARFLSVRLVQPVKRPSDLSPESCQR